MIKRPIHLSHDFLAQVLDDESVVVDATMGNGNDTAFLAGLAKRFMPLTCRSRRSKRLVNACRTWKLKMRNSFLEWS